MQRFSVFLAVSCVFVLAASADVCCEAGASPLMIAYSAFPTPYFNEHNDEVARLYDGFFFVVGAWDTGAEQQLGLKDGVASQTEWKNRVAENVLHLREAGASANFLGVCFSDNGAWPSAETLLSEDFTRYMARQFGAIAHEAKNLGFRGLSIDVEYPYPRYSLDHPVYTYDRYTAEELLDAASAQGRAITTAILDAYPEVEIALLPGSLWSRPIARVFQLAILQTMAERNAPGGLHFFTERSYSLLDPVSQVGIPREGDLAVHALVHDPAVLAYWNQYCTVAPGVWPLHMVETGGKDYPVRPWPEEMAELRQQMGILRCLAKRYVWSFSGNPVWHPYTPAIREQYGLADSPFPEADSVIAQWHAILSDKVRAEEPALCRLIQEVRRFDRGELAAPELCAALGTPGEWLVLGPLSNPLSTPAFAAPHALLRSVAPHEVVAGRDGVARWTPFRNYEPVGGVRVMAYFDWFKTDMASVQLISDIVSVAEQDGILHLGWDDGAAVWLNGDLVLDRQTYPERGHGAFFRDRYDFEERVAVALRQGRNRLAVLCINQRGHWGVNVRLTDREGWPLAGVTFSLPRDVDDQAPVTSP